MHIKRTICGILTSRKKEMGVTYEQLIANTGLSRNQLSWVFNHEGRGVSLSKIELLAEELEVELEIHEIR